jgi:hypothetical protein
VLKLLGREVFSSDPQYPRARYIRHGAMLMLLKYAVDAAAILLVTGVLWTPVDYVLSLASLQGSKAASFPLELNAWLLLWTLPFLCLGIILSTRRARDAGLPPWIVVAFFIPVLNYALMILLAAWPTRSTQPESSVPDSPATRGSPNSALAAGIIAGLVAGLICVGLGALFIQSYGVALFLATPFVVGAASAYVAESINPSGVRQATFAVLATLGVVAGALLLIAMEGLLCMLMAAPLAVPLAVLGGMVGQSMSHWEARGPAGIALLLVLLPSGQAIDKAIEQSPTRVVESAIVVDAPPTEVWEHVVKFDDIVAAPAWYFRAGLSYPVRARIEGRGTGAIRHCEFTTGSFVEPITAWEAPRRLAFDVTAQPAPLTEWSPYANVYAPHVQGFFKTTQGEFRLIPLPGGRTRLEGRTWYSLRMQPQAYWTLISDVIIHRIHDRVLRHIKDETEAAR